MAHKKKITLGILNVAVITTSVVTVVSCSSLFSGGDQDKLLNDEKPVLLNIPPNQRFGSYLERLSLGSKITHYNLSTKELAAKIHDAKTLKDELGIDLFKFDKHATYKVSAVDLNELIIIDVEMTKENTKDVFASGSIRVMPKQMKQNEMSDIAEKIKEVFKTGKVAHASLKSSEIASRINNFPSLKDELGIDLSNFTKKFKYIVSSQGYTRGYIGVSVTITNSTSSKNSTILKTVTAYVDHESDYSIEEAAREKQYTAKFQSLLKTAKVIHTNLDAWELGRNITSIETLKDELGIDFSPFKQDFDFDISAWGYVDGKIKLTIKIKGKSIYDYRKTLIQNIQHDSVADTQIKLSKARHTKTLNDFLKKGTIKHPNLKASEIAAKIHDVPSLYDELGINLKWIQFGGIQWSRNTFTVSAHGDANGVITLSISMDYVIQVPISSIYSKNAAITISGKSKIQHVADSVIDSRDAQKRNKLIQQKDFSVLKSTLKGGSIAHPNLKASEIAAKIHDVSSLQNELGIDLSTLNSSSTYAISSQGDTSGVITVSVIMTTNHVTNPLTWKYKISHIADSALGNSIVVTDADLVNKTTLAEINSWLQDLLTNPNPTKNYDFSQVTTIPKSAFENITELPENINFSKKLVSIGRYAFSNLIQLPENINFSGVTRIGAEAFESLGTNPFDPSIQLPENIDFSSLTWIGVGAFPRITKLPENIDFSNVTTIESSAFGELISLPENINLSNLREIGLGAFRSLESLPENIDFSNLETIGDKILGEDTTRVSTDKITVIKNVTGAFQSLTELPDNLNLSKLRYIGYETFGSLHKLPDNIDLSSVTVIGVGAFRWINDLPENIDFSNVTRIEESAFQSLLALPENIDFSNVTFISDFAFNSLNKLPDNIDLSNLVEVGNESFSELKTLPDKINLSKLSIIGEKAFNNIIALPKNIDLSSLTEIGANAFKRLVVLPENINFSSLTKIGTNAFAILTLLPDNIDLSHVTHMGESAFRSLISLPDNMDLSSLTELEANTFGSLVKLPSGIDFSGVLIIHNQAFNSLERISRNMKLNKNVIIRGGAFDYNLLKAIKLMIKNMSPSTPVPTK